MFKNFSILFKLGVSLISFYSDLVKVEGKLFVIKLPI